MCSRHTRISHHIVLIEDLGCCGSHELQEACKVEDLEPRNVSDLRIFILFDTDIILIFLELHLVFSVVWQVVEKHFDFKGVGCNVKHIEAECKTQLTVFFRVISTRSDIGVQVVSVGKVLDRHYRPCVPKITKLKRGSNGKCCSITVFGVHDSDASEV